MGRQRPQAVDPRVIVLLIIGALIIIRYMPHPPDDIIGDQATILSINTPDKGRTLYYCQTGGNSWPAIFQSVGLKPPRIENAPWPPSGFSAYNLISLKSPEPTDLPAEIAPFAFLPIPINTAKLDTLTMIPGIGMGLAREIINYRLKHGAFRDKSDLEKIRGIGSVKSQHISEYISF